MRLQAHLHILSPLLTFLVASSASGAVVPEQQVPPQPKLLPSSAALLRRERESRRTGRSLQSSVLSPDAAPQVALAEEGRSPQPAAPGCYLKRPVSSSCQGFDQWTRDEYGEEHLNSAVSEMACFGRKHEHDRYCHSVSQWLFVANPAAEPTPVALRADPNMPREQEPAQGSDHHAADAQLGAKGKTFRKPPATAASGAPRRRFYSAPVVAGADGNPPEYAATDGRPPRVSKAQQEAADLFSAGVPDASSPAVAAADPVANAMRTLPHLTPPAAPASDSIPMAAPVASKIATIAPHDSTAAQGQADKPDGKTLPPLPLDMHYLKAPDPKMDSPEVPARHEEDYLKAHVEHLVDARMKALEDQIQANSVKSQRELDQKVESRLRERLANNQDIKASTDANLENTHYISLGTGWCRTKTGTPSFYLQRTGHTLASCKSQCNKDHDCVGFNADDSGYCAIMVPGANVAPPKWDFKSRGDAPITHGNGVKGTECMKKIDVGLVNAFSPSKQTPSNGVQPTPQVTDSVTTSQDFYGRGTQPTPAGAPQIPASPIDFGTSQGATAATSIGNANQASCVDQATTTFENNGVAASCGQVKSARLCDNANAEFAAKAKRECPVSCGVCTPTVTGPAPTPASNPVVKVTYIINNVDFSAMTPAHVLRMSDSIKTTIAGYLRSYETNILVTLSAGNGVIVDAVIETPQVNVQNVKRAVEVQQGNILGRTMDTYNDMKSELVATGAVTTTGFTIAVQGGVGDAVPGQPAVPNQPASAKDCNTCVREFAAIGGCAQMGKPNVDSYIPPGCQHCGAQAAKQCGFSEGTPSSPTPAGEPSAPGPPPKALPGDVRFKMRLKSIQYPKLQADPQLEQDVLSAVQSAVAQEMGVPVNLVRATLPPQSATSSLEQVGEGKGHSTSKKWWTVTDYTETTQKEFDIGVQNVIYSQLAANPALQEQFEIAIGQQIIDLLKPFYAGGQGIQVNTSVHSGPTATPVVKVHLVVGTPVMLVDPLVVNFVLTKLSQNGVLLDSITTSLRKLGDVNSFSNEAPVASIVLLDDQFFTTAGMSESADGSISSSSSEGGGTVSSSAFKRIGTNGTASSETNETSAANASTEASLELLPADVSTVDQQTVTTKSQKDGTDGPSTQPSNTSTTNTSAATNPDNAPVNSLEPAPNSTNVTTVLFEMLGGYRDGKAVKPRSLLEGVGVTASLLDSFVRTSQDVFTDVECEILPGFTAFSVSTLLFKEQSDGTLSTAVISSLMQVPAVQQMTFYSPIQVEFIQDTVTPGGGGVVPPFPPIADGNNLNPNPYNLPVFDPSTNPFPPIADGNNLNPNPPIFDGRNLNPNAHGWSYENAELWSQTYPTCGGKKQSPIDIDTTKIFRTPGVPANPVIDHVRFDPLANLMLMNTGKYLVVDGAFGTVELPDGTYKVQGFKVHFPAEHKINGKTYLGELQIIAQKSGAAMLEGLAAISLMIADSQDPIAMQDLSDADQWRSLAFFRNIGFGRGVLPDTNQGSFNIRTMVDLMMFSTQLAGPYFYYEGSVTEPPCTESVKWMVLEYPAVATVAMSELFLANFQGKLSARPVQPLNNRKLYPDFMRTREELKNTIADLQAKIRRGYYGYPSVNGTDGSPNSMTWHVESIISVNYVDQDELFENPRNAPAKGRLVNITADLLGAMYGFYHAQVTLKVGPIDSVKMRILVDSPPGNIEVHGPFVSSLMNWKSENASFVSALESALNGDYALARISTGAMTVSILKGPEIIVNTTEAESDTDFDLRKKEGYKDRPSWAVKPQRLAGIYKLPMQSNCTLHSTLEMGTSDYGQGYHLCQTCATGCTSDNMQPSILATWSTSPPLYALNAFDMMMMVEYLSVQQLAPFSLNGVWHKMRVEISRNGASKPWFIEMGPQVRGGVGPGDALQGKHVAMISDTELPSPDGTLVKGRWLAMPSKRRPGDIGECKRACVGCDDYPQLSASGLSTGTLCSIDVGMDNGMGFVYRIHKVKDEQQVNFDGANYMGSEWQINIHDTTTGGFYVLARVILEGNAPQNGIRNFAATHQHLGCAPCDAYYQATRVTGPFILQPKNVHAHLYADYQLQQKIGTQCAMHRVSGLGGYSILYESGPTVWPAKTVRDKKQLIYQCDKSDLNPSWKSHRG